MNAPWLSVIMPTYNGAAYVAAALESVCQQDDPNVEVVVVDDGSTDSTPEIVEGFQDRVALRLVRRRHEGNWVRNTNLGMSLARGERLCWLHQDDCWKPGRLAQIKQTADRCPDAALILHPSEFVTSGGQRVGSWGCPFPDRAMSLQPKDILAPLLVQCFVASCAPVFKRAASEAIGKVDEELPYLADWDYWLRLASVGTTAYCPASLCAFRLHGESQTIAISGVIDGMRRQYAVVLQRHGGLLAAQPAAVRRAAALSVEMNLALAGLVRGRAPHWRSLASRLLFAGPNGWRRYMRDSRIVERCSSRVRAGLCRLPQTPHAAGACQDARRPREADPNPLGVEAGA